MIYFLIPLKSKHSSSNWSKVQTLLNNTLTSICHQSSDQYKIALAVHDVPDIDLPDQMKKKIELIQVQYPEPDHNLHERRIDKHYKKRHLAHYVYEQGGGNMMFVDADDFVSKKISLHVDQHPDEHGWYIADGYEYHMDSGKIKRAPKFDKFCGTCGILNLKKADLPTSVPFEGYESRDRVYLFDHGHNTWVNKFAEIGRPLKKLPFRGAMYTLNTDENTSQMNKDNKGGALKRRLYRKLMPPVMNTAKVKQEFGIESWA